MRQESIEVRKARRKKDAVRGVMLFGLIQVITATAFVSLCFVPDSPRWLDVLWLVLAGVCLLVMVPAVWMLKKRFEEIEGGELDAAAEY